MSAQQVAVSQQLTLQVCSFVIRFICDALFFQKEVLPCVVRSARQFIVRRLC